MKTGVIDVGGGTRDIFGAGIFDQWMEMKITFDYGIGVSAGSANLVSYQSHQIYRNKRFYIDYIFRKEYMSFSNFIKKGSYLDLDYIYGTLSNSKGEDPVDYETFVKNSMEFEIVATDAHTGEAIYLDGKKMPKDRYDYLKASCCIPVMNRPYPLGNHFCFDGGLSDPIPLQRAFEKGCEKIVLILTKPKDQYRDPKKDQLPTKVLKHRYPYAAQSLSLRAHRYNLSLQQATELEKQGKVLILAPEGTQGIKTLTKDKEKLEDLYQQGRKIAQDIKMFIQS